MRGKRLRIMIPRVAGMMVMKKICRTVSQNGKCKSLDVPKKTVRPKLTMIGMENRVSRLFTEVMDKDKATLPRHK